MSNPAGDRKCELTFRPDRAAGGLALAFGASCGQTFPVISGVAAWTIAPGGGIRWLDRAGAAILDFEETEVGIFEALKAGDPNVYFLTQSRPRRHIATHSRRGDRHLVARPAARPCAL